MAGKAWDWTHIFRSPINQGDPVAVELSRDAFLYFEKCTTLHEQYLGQQPFSKLHLHSDHFTNYKVKLRKTLISQPTFDINMRAVYAKFQLSGLKTKWGVWGYGWADNTQKKFDT